MGSGVTLSLESPGQCNLSKKLRDAPPAEAPNEVRSVGGGTGVALSLKPPERLYSTKCGVKRFLMTFSLNQNFEFLITIQILILKYSKLNQNSNFEIQNYYVIPILVVK